MSLVSLIVAIFVLNLWSFYDRWRFTRFEGDIKRGVRIGTYPLSQQAYQFLETLPNVVRYGNCFIRREGRELLISEEQAFWLNFLTKRRRWPHVGYINLSASESQLEFRVSLPYLIYIFVLAVFALTLSGLLILFFLNVSWDDGSGPPFFIYLFPIMALVGVVNLIIFYDYQERQHLLVILKKATEQKD